MPLTSAEAALGQGYATDPTIPNRVLLSGGISITAPRSAGYHIPKQKAEQVAIENASGLSGRPVLRRCILVDIHDINGNPASGTLTWLVDITPDHQQIIGSWHGGPIGRSSSSPVSTPDSAPAKTYVYVLIDARSGAELYEVIGQ